MFWNFIILRSVGNNSNNDRNDDRNNWRTTSEIKRRVTFKPRGGNRQLNDVKIRAILGDDEMIDDLTQGEGSGARMSGEFVRGRGNYRNRRKGSPVPRNFVGKLVPHPTSWYQVTITHGAKYDRDTIMKLLMAALTPTIFRAHYFRVDNETRSAHFYVDEFDQAEKIASFDRKIELPDGFMMQLRVRGSVPHVKVDDQLKERMKMAMVKRYNQATKAMDLTKFHEDSDLTDIFCALFRPPIMSTAIDIIAENIPDLEALNLNDNKLLALDHLKNIASKLPNLKILYLGNNKVSVAHVFA